MPRILAIEDDPKIIEAIEKSFSLEKGFVLKATSDTEKALHDAIAYKPDLILLDVKLPGGDGRQIIKNLKENHTTRSIPVIFLTGMAGEGDRVLGLNLGADDYIVKPFGAMELLARIRAVLRRFQTEATPATIKSHGLVLDQTNRVSVLNGKRLRLQPKEFDVLYLLASQPGKTLTREFLIESTSGYGQDVPTRSLDTHIKNLRKKLGSTAKWIETIPKLGYRWIPTA